HKIHWELQLPGPPEATGPPPEDNVIWARDEPARKALTALVGRYRLGDEVTAYHDPSAPADACLVYVPFEPTRHGFGLWFTLGVLAVLWSIFAIVWWVSSRRPASGPSA